MSDDAKPVNTPKPTVSVPPAVPLGYYARIAAAEARRFRRNLTRENLNAFLKNLAWVIPLTLLIWVYAERTNTRNTLPNVSIHINIQQVPNKVITIVTPADSNFECSLSGAKPKLDGVGNVAARDYTIKLDVSATGLERLEAKPLIEAISAFKDEGISITSCNPPQISVYVDNLETVEVPVKLPENINPNISAVFNPPTIKISAASEQLKKLTPATGQLAVVAETAGITSLPLGEHKDVNVTLKPIDGVTFSPASVTATVKVEEKDATLVLDTVAVELLAPGSP